MERKKSAPIPPALLDQARANVQQCAATLGALTTAAEAVTLKAADCPEVLRPMHDLAGALQLVRSQLEATAKELRWP